MDKMSSFQTLVGTLYKKYNKASVYGKLELQTLYLLNLVNRLLYECPTCNSTDINNKLICLAIKLKYSDKEICNYNIDKGYYINNVDIFNNSVLNNSPIKVINTPPIISDPDESDPEIGIPPTLCELLKTVSLIGSSKYSFKQEELNGCFEDPNNPTGTVRYLKIISLPLYNPLTFNGINTTVNQIIDLNTVTGDFDGLLYESIITGAPISDFFTYKVSTSSFPTVYNDQIITMNIEVI